MDMEWGKMGFGLFCRDSQRGGGERGRGRKIRTKVEREIEIEREKDRKRGEERNSMDGVTSRFLRHFISTLFVQSFVPGHTASRMSMRQWFENAKNTQEHYRLHVSISLQSFPLPVASSQFDWNHLCQRTGFNDSDNLIFHRNIFFLCIFFLPDFVKNSILHEKSELTPLFLFIHRKNGGSTKCARRQLKMQQIQINTENGQTLTSCTHPNEHHNSKQSCPKTSKLYSYLYYMCVTLM